MKTTLYIFAILAFFVLLGLIGKGMSGIDKDHRDHP